MPPSDALMSELTKIMKLNTGTDFNKYRVPPPVYTTMKAEVISFDQEKSQLIVKFPIEEKYLNPYHALQGGIIAAAVDNTLGPLSLLVAPPNVTRTLEMTYSRPVTPDMKFIIVEAELIERLEHRLHFKASVRNAEGQRVARAKAVHWIVDLQNSGKEN